jgi:hypothetical protein
VTTVHITIKSDIGKHRPPLNNAKTECRPGRTERLQPLSLPIFSLSATQIPRQHVDSYSRDSGSPIR